MKTILLCLSLLFIVQNSTAQFINIPDTAFKSAILHPYYGYDINLDNEIDSAEALLIDTVWCQNRSVFSLTGIESFPNLVSLNFAENHVTTLDLSHNPLVTHVYGNQNSINSINLTGCTQLILLRLYFNQIPSIDLSDCPLLEFLDIVGNSVDSLDLTANPAIWSLDCFSNQMKYLNVANGNNTNITHFFGDWNLYNCITVDDPAYSYANWIGFSYIFDSTTVFSTNCSTLGVDELSRLEKVEIYPNPTSNTFQIDVPEPVSFVIFNSFGQRVEAGQLNSGQNQISIGHVTPGIYIMKIQVKNGISKTIRVNKM